MSSRSKFRALKIVADTDISIVIWAVACGGR